ncbi:MAG: 4-hydroxy-3-methylbut-2-en-1-yl diphosphate synthase [Muribaculaceae bacterium]|nr:4-hydroxy-3-methylbut-2-en-1-yl diphosphate synthase [Muribaculaceae bacterium]
MNKDFNYSRRKTWAVNVAGTPLGGDNPIRVQSMTSTSTNDIEASVVQAERIADAGADYVRLTAQGVKEADNIGVIRTKLRADGYATPLVADIHFNPRAAFAAAKVTDKVRINPGNFVDAARTFKKLEYTDEEYSQEILKINEALIPFIAVCRENHTAVRIGVNHGSLSDRIMSRYGDTPAGMVESAMEFLRVFVAEKFLDVVISIKASNTVVMVETVRRLIVAMDAEEMHFPLHLGVTEAGDGEDGRIKSAVGIGTLLSEGIGDTIRVSLSEEPELELPVARKLVDYITSRADHPAINGNECSKNNYIEPMRRHSSSIDIIGGNNLPIVVSNYFVGVETLKLKPDYIYCGDGKIPSFNARFIVPLSHYNSGNNISPIAEVADIEALKATKSTLKWLKVDANSSFDFALLNSNENIVIALYSSHINISGSIQAFINTMQSLDLHNPVVIAGTYNDTDSESLQVKAGADMGTVLMNGYRDGIWLTAPQYAHSADIVRFQYGILQAARLRTTKTEYISCPSCGRTLFDLQATVKRVKEATSHLTHLKIGIMGCIVNGPGEMADADYGYVGAAPHKVSLYKGKQCIEMNIPQEEAITHLIALIKANNDWKAPQ